mmetsp:Transcript_25221/g.57581  ORF Transcript_25221/g.57581 Transcript_25221/m.57581 type:complete len:205 (+) Transcript_25221:69-683(+)
MLPKPATIAVATKPTAVSRAIFPTRITGDVRRFSSWRRRMALGYCTLRSTLVAFSQLHLSDSTRPFLPISGACPRFSSNHLTFSMMASESPTACRNPVSPSRMLSGIPPARAPITGTPDAMLSSTTNPRVSESEGMQNTSADANADQSGSPVSIPVKTVLVPAKTSLSCSSCGPFPTIASRTFGNLSMIGRRSSMRFSLPRRPT